MIGYQCYDLDGNKCFPFTFGVILELSLEEWDQVNDCYIEIKIIDTQYREDSNFIFKLPVHWMDNPDQGLRRLIYESFKLNPNIKDPIAALSKETYFYLGDSTKGMPCETNHRHKISLTQLSAILTKIFEEEQFWQMAVLIYC
jgi:hypothetical protein